MKQPSGYQIIRRHLRRYPRTLRHTLIKELSQLITYEPVIGIMGKTGAGKSSLCNALFRSEVCAVNAVEACTRKPQRVRLRFGQHYLTLVDLPGVGESQSRDKEYRELYREQLPKLDMVLWVLKADDRAFSVEETFYQFIQARCGNTMPPVLWVLNQVDKVEPSEQWNRHTAMPSPGQLEHIKRKQQAVASQLGIQKDAVIPVSVKGRYHLAHIVERMINRLPKQARSPLLPHLHQSYHSTPIQDTARSSFGDAVVDTLDHVIDSVPLPLLVRQALQAVTHTVAHVARSVWSFFFD
ncbi:MULTISPECIES: GTPase family protein [Pseudocitrobacter]|uniref:G domain-containing protein n=1 Tax=Pseudocitrobacter vendiensis TaxID=2488306 RepID=A0ABN8T9Z4_9ENTR|nr:MULTISPECIES: GTPase [Pseudocitrobacter]MDF3826879.1 50S ribosome-binding GTPase [Pseudocitrobacter sp. 2023EL-00150]MEC5372458.1 50S ribosome-binding GTPase [Pseudocitrobacter sp. MW920760]CAH6636229.1 G domain-containing protein [Pseudocitrobacter vendiensis]